jgi:hypothetical protein
MMASLVQIVMLLNDWENHKNINCKYTHGKQRYTKRNTKQILSNRS